MELEEIIREHKQFCLSTTALHLRADCEKCIFIAKISSLRQQLAEQETIVAALDVMICGMKEEFHRIAGKLSRIGEINLGTDISRILSSTPTCPHKERAERITQAETAEQARLINERDAAKEEAEKLKEDNQHKEELVLKVAGLRQTCSNLSREKGILEEQLAAKDEEKAKVLAMVDSRDFREGHEIDNTTPNELREILYGLALQLAAKDARIKELEGHLPDNCQRGECGQEGAITVGEVSAQAINLLIDRLARLVDEETRGEVIVEIANFISSVAGEAVHGAITQRDATICGMKEALEALGCKPNGYCFCVERAQVEAGHTGECLEAQKALSSTPTCPHVAKVESLAIQLKGSNERAMLVLAAKNDWADRARRAEKEVEKLKEELVVGQAGGRLLKAIQEETEAQLEQARQTLAPFAKLNFDHFHNEPDSKPIYGNMDEVLTLGDFRRAKALTERSKDGSIR